MATTANKVKFGLSHVHYAPITDISDAGDVTYAKPIAIPGAVSLSLEPQGEVSNFYADNGVYYAGSPSGGYSGDLEMALFPTNFLQAVLGQIVRLQAIYEVTMPEITEFALMFQFEGDKKSIRHCLYRCTATTPAISSATTEDSVEVQTETSTITAMPLPNGVVKYRESDQASDAKSSTWFDHVPIIGSTDTVNDNGTVIIAGDTDWNVPSE